MVQPSGLKPLDILEFASCLMAGVNERIELTKLKFNGRAYGMFFDNFSGGPNNLQAMLHTSLMVIRQIQNKHIVKVEILVHHVHDLSRGGLKQF
jgi:hypothetical protein